MSMNTMDADLSSALAQADFCNASWERAVTGAVGPLLDLAGRLDIQVMTLTWGQMDKENGGQVEAIQQMTSEVERKLSGTLVRLHGLKAEGYNGVVGTIRGLANATGEPRLKVELGYTSVNQCGVELGYTSLAIKPSNLEPPNEINLVDIDDCAAEKACALLDRTRGLKKDAPIDAQAAQWLKNIDGVCKGTFGFARMRPSRQSDVWFWEPCIPLEVGCEGISRIVLRACQILQSENNLPFYAPSGKDSRVARACVLLMNAGGLCDDSWHRDRDHSGGDSRRKYKLRLTSAGVRALVGVVELLLLAVMNGKVPLDAVEKVLAPACCSLTGGDAAAMAALQASGIVAAGLKYIRFRGCQAKQVHMLCSIKYDEPLFVLDSAGKRGWAFKMSGVADNFQLLGLLNPTLGRAGLMKSTYPAATVLSWQGVSDAARGSLVNLDATLMQFTAMQPDGTLDWAHKHWVWGEGVPIDILRLYGERICLVVGAHDETAPHEYMRMVPASPIFEPVKAYVELIATLTAAEVEDKLKKMSAVGPEMRARAEATLLADVGLTAAPARRRHGKREPTAEEREAARARAAVEQADRQRRHDEREAAVAAEARALELERRALVAADRLAKLAAPDKPFTVTQPQTPRTDKRGKKGRALRAKDEAARQRVHDVHTSAEQTLIRHRYAELKKHAAHLAAEARKARERADALAYWEREVACDDAAKHHHVPGAPTLNGVVRDALAKADGGR